LAKCAVEGGDLGKQSFGEAVSQIVLDEVDEIDRQLVQQEHFHCAIRFVTPSKRHGGKDRDALANRTILSANARA